MPEGAALQASVFAIFAQPDYPASFCINEIESAAPDRPAAL